ncbi:hypothetical protein [Winogradskyella luteola]|uniref:ATP-grasp domain-containing protein n=1 Tax=Winogradskyella luteola TaxID=2828330 RepID=A0A9X1F9W3_9FLAO|nr:hypothetical protein [Winogradskyella luteola]MBV7269248.1 hypothetical protein [Winogradskyella luteola]
MDNKNKTIVFLVDYNSRFSYKWSASPYKSGVDKELLKEEFKKFNRKIMFLSYMDIDFRDSAFYNDKIFLYTSQEDQNLFYKSFVEDIILGLEMIGAEVIPGYKYLRAHHNKLFMEIMRDAMPLKGLKNIKSDYFGTYEEFKTYADSYSYPVVLKSAFGATSKGVTLIRNKKEALKKTKSYSVSKNFWYDLKDVLRSIKHKGYRKESKYRRKFIVQNLVPGMDRDYKILVFGKKYYVLERKVKKNDFRASGSGLINYTKDLPEGMLNFAMKFFEYQKLPFFAMDVAFNGSEFFLIEFQALQFGTHTLDTSPYYFTLKGNEWLCVEEKTVLEIEMALAIENFIVDQQ